MSGVLHIQPVRLCFIKVPQRIMFLDPIPLNGCVRQNSLEEAAIVSLLTQSAVEWRQVKWTSCQRIQQTTQKTQKTNKKKKTGVITLSYTQTFNLKRTHTLFLQMRKRSKLFQLHFKRYSFF